MQHRLILAALAAMAVLATTSVAGAGEHCPLSTTTTTTAPPTTTTAPPTSTTTAPPPTTTSTVPPAELIPALVVVRAPAVATTPAFTG